MIYILGINSFLAKNFYIFLKQTQQTQTFQHSITYLHHDFIKDNIIFSTEDTIINFCGVNRSDNYKDFETGNYTVVKDLLDLLKNNNVSPMMIHISSAMVNGFLYNKELQVYQKYYIETKLKAEKLLLETYDKNKLCILRPSNIYGYNCKPYYNNLLVTLIYEKITGQYKTTNLNKNCTRNFLSIEGFCKTLSNIITNQTIGLYNIFSDNNISLDKLIHIIYNGKLPNNINIIDGPLDIISDSNNCKSIIISENLNTLIESLEKNMINFIDISTNVKISNHNVLSQDRGNMIEISDLHNKRLYMITINYGYMRGNHYHDSQIEQFYIYKGEVMVCLKYKDKNVIYNLLLQRNNSIIVNPKIIHTFINDGLNIPDIFIVSNQEYIPNSSPDTVYKNVFEIN